MDQKQVVQKFLDLGITHEQAMFALGIVCEQTNLAYMEGYDRGWKAAKPKMPLGMPSHQIVDCISKYQLKDHNFSPPSEV